MDPGFLQIAASVGGLGGVIAVLMLHWKRADDVSHREEIRALVSQMNLSDERHREELGAVLNRMEARDERLLEVIGANTQVLVTLQRSVEVAASLTRIEQRMVAMGEEGRYGGERPKSRE